MIPWLLLAVTIAIAHVDLNRTGWNANETSISPSVLQSGTKILSLIGSYVTDGPIFSQPLVVSATINGSQHNALLTCTMKNSCYAFDADNPGVQLWHTSLGAAPRLVNYPNDGFLYNSVIGCLATPAVDMALNLAFAVCGTNTPTWVLYELNISTGAVVNSVTVTATASGTGDPTGGDTASGGVVTFNPAFELSRSDVTVANGNVYIFFSSYDDIHPWHGWAMAYSESTLTRVGSWCATPNGGGGGIWGGSGGPAVDASGNLFLSTGNGDWDGTANFGTSIVKLSPTLTLLDWFTPSNWASINTGDNDLASNRIILIPNTTLLVHTGKSFQVFLLDQTNLGHLQGGGGQAPVQAFTIAGTPNGESGAYGSAWMNGTYYVPAVSGTLSAYSFNGSVFNQTAALSAGFSVGAPGTAAISTSSNGVLGGIVWLVTTAGVTSAWHAPQPGVLHALDSSNFNEVWNSGTALGTMTKFAAPAVVNGKVYVSTQDSQVQVFGLINAPPPPPPAMIRLNKRTHSSSGGRDAFY